MIVEMPAPSRPRRIATTFGALVTAEPTLFQLLSEKLPAKTAYHVAKLSRLVQQELAHFHMTRGDYIKELGEALPDGNIQVKPDSIEEFSRRMNELAAVEVTIEWGPLLLTDLPATITGHDIIRLGPLLEDVEG